MVIGVGLPFVILFFEQYNVLLTLSLYTANEENLIKRTKSHESIFSRSGRTEQKWEQQQKQRYHWVSTEYSILKWNSKFSQDETHRIYIKSKWNVLTQTRATFEKTHKRTMHHFPSNLTQEYFKCYTLPGVQWEQEKKALSYYREHLGIWYLI